MKLNNFHMSDKNYSIARIEVPGLGEISIKNCISDDLRSKIGAETIVVLKEKLKVNENKS